MRDEGLLNMQPDSELTALRVWTKEDSLKPWPWIRIMGP